MPWQVGNCLRIGNGPCIGNNLPFRLKRTMTYSTIEVDPLTIAQGVLEPRDFP